MANKILDKSAIADGICRFIIEAPRIARKRKAANFVVVRANEYAERIPLLSSTPTSNAAVSP
jgi:ferredoxin/flavodoxin---NADP+ reductase